MKSNKFPYPPLPQSPDLIWWYLDKGSLHIKSYDILITWSEVATWQIKQYIPTSKRSIVAKLIQVLVYNKALLQKELHGTLTTWSCEVKGQMKSNVFLYSQRSWPQNWTVVTNDTGSTIMIIAMWDFDHKRVKWTYLQIHKATCVLNQIFVWGHVQNKIETVELLQGLLSLNMSNWWLWTQ